jgi:cytochrome c oxidase assembly protein subunit 15
LTGLALGGGERADIHKLHRLVAVLTAMVVLAAGLLALRAKLGWNAVLIIALTVTEFSVGIAAIVTKLPISVAVAHNWLAAMLLLALLRLLALCNNRQALF